MYVAQLALQDFRSYESVELALDPGISTFIGANGQGKTNLVEAIGYVATHGSHRVASDSALVRSGTSRAIVRAGVVRDERKALVEIEINPGKANRVRLNRAAVPRPREVLGMVRTVLFAPEDLAMVKGDPGERRRFLDELLVARAPRFAGVRSDYDRVLKQRNALLKSAAAHRRAPGAEVLATLDVWDSHLAKAGAELMSARLELVSALRPLVAAAYESLAPGAPAGLEYRPSVDLEPAAARPAAPTHGSLSTDRGYLAEALVGGLAKVRKSELERGTSLVGPHRDELALRLGELPVRGYASHGESWSFTLALRLASYELLRADGDDPVLILDDVFAELDSGRRTRLAELVSPAEQVLVTAAVQADVPDRLAGATYEVAEGKVTRG